MNFTHHLKNDSLNLFSIVFGNYIHSERSIFGVNAQLSIPISSKILKTKHLILEFPDLFLILSIKNMIGMNSAKAFLSYFLQRLFV